MPTKNLGPCLIIGCTNTNVQFRTITALAYEKCQRKRTLEVYPYLEPIPINPQSNNSINV
ncbi:hypothetical protein C2G38_2233953 [Gigaspora rosea]|uniref:Uncharacterized protein n=1 Tax=Gigaspora rosea TaxID=44941 RepID=A0A397TV22_9GLOM|nr:hypothetical protein C2G38_2233953 [Gigaspora rosea]